MKTITNRFKFFIGLTVVFVIILLYLITGTKTDEPYTIDKPLKSKLETVRQSYIQPNNTSSLLLNGVFLVVTRNQDLYSTKKTIQQIEDAFNHNKGYPYLFLNNEPFSEDFISHVSELIKSKIEFDVIPKEHWDVPSFIDTNKMHESSSKMKDYPHGDSVSYRQLMRYFSGFFYKHPKILKYDYYWKIEPDAEYTCDIVDDPFVKMHKNNKKYAFTISMFDFQPTIESLWTVVKQYIKENPNDLSSNGSMDFISDDRGSTYNNCHFWSNFEIGDLSFYKSSQYEKYFSFLDKSGNFFYERWGDGPVHTIALSLLLNKSEIWFADEIGYKHTDIGHCPTVMSRSNKCGCSLSDSVDNSGGSCLPKWQNMFK